MPSVKQSRVKNLLIFTGFSGALGFSLTVSSLETPSASDLISTCKVYVAGERSTAAASCKAYLQGFLSASGKIADEESRLSPFVTRALRTRGRRLSEDAEQQLYSPYCLPADESLDNLIDKVAAVEDNFSQDTTAAAVVQSVFDKFYLCDRKF